MLCGRNAARARAGLGPRPNDVPTRDQEQQVEVATLSPLWRIRSMGLCCAALRSGGIGEHRDRVSAMPDGLSEFSAPPPNATLMRGP